MKGNETKQQGHMVARTKQEVWWKPSDCWRSDCFANIFPVEMHRHENSLSKPQFSINRLVCMQIYYKSDCAYLFLCRFYVLMFCFCLEVME